MTSSKSKGSYKLASPPGICYVICLSKRHSPPLERNEALKQIVESKLASKWSPEQISGWLQNAFADVIDMQVSHETIYKSLFLQSRGILKKELVAHLRTGRVMRQSRSNNFRGSARGGIIGAVSIRDRPKEVEDRAIPGHWEGDLISGSNNSHIATLVERRSRFTMLIKLKGKDTDSVVRALARKIKQLPEELRKSLTWDRGQELAKHQEFTVETGVKVYLCDPQSPWQRGTNENTNRLVRQYLPRKTDLTVHSQAELNRISKELNQRPRMTLRYRTPAQVFSEMLH